MSNVKRLFNAMMMVMVFMGVLVLFSIGYKIYFVDAGHNAMGPIESGAQAATSGQTAQGTTGQKEEADVLASYYTAPAISQAGVIRTNRDTLDWVLSNLNDTMQYLTMEPTGISTAKKDNAAEDKKAKSSRGSDPAPDVNMQDMGPIYDVEKMAQLHSGLYKIAVGTALLKELRNEMISQESSADLNTEYPIQYYTGQHDQAVHSKSKLSYALTYLGDTANLVSLNPYIYEGGLSYDNERMSKLHQSVLKLAEGLAAANVLESNLSYQAENYATLALNYTNHAAVTSSAPETNEQAVSQQANHPAASPIADLLNNVNLNAIANMLPFVFGAFFLLAMIGYIFHLKKAGPQPETADVVHEKIG